MKGSGISRTARAGVVLLLGVFAFVVPAAADVTVPPHTISIDDVTMNEGNSGTTAFVFTVTLSNPPLRPSDMGNFSIMVSYTTTDGSATAGTCAGGADYVATAGQLTFNKNQLTRTITVQVCGDTTVEPDETFFVDLTNPTNEHDEVIVKSRGTGTIRNDDVVVVRPTTTTVDCPASTPANTPTNCTVRVRDTGSGTPTPPLGTVDFSFTSQPSGSTPVVAPDPCTLAPDATTPATDDSACTITFTADTTGNYAIQGTYQPTSAHTTSTGSDTIQVTARTTTTTINCPATTPANTPATCTVTVTDTDTAPKSPPLGTVDFSFTSQPSGSTPVVAPDPCTLTAASSNSSTCTITFTSTLAGLYTIEGTYDPAPASPHAGSSGSDTIEVEPGPPAILTLTPTAATNPVNDQHCVTATVTDEFGNPTPGVTVRFSVTGANPTSGSDVTNAAGQAKFCYTGILAGGDVIRAFADTNNNGTRDLATVPPEPEGEAAKAWTAPPSTPLCVVEFTTLGIQIIARNGDHGTGGGNVHVSEAGLASGSQEYHDHGPAEPINVHATEILAVVCTTTANGKQSTIYFNANVDGAGPRPGRIEVEDNGEPGSTDTYWIIVSKLTGLYDSGKQALKGGNVQIH
jgi:hypothetical protein